MTVERYNKMSIVACRDCQALNRAFVELFQRQILDAMPFSLNKKSFLYINLWETRPAQSIISVLWV